MKLLYKHRVVKRLLKTTLTLLTILAFAHCDAQPITGTWAGLADINGQPLKAVFHITQQAGTYAATFDSPDQGAMGLKASAVTVVADSIIIELKVIGGSFTGKWNKQDKINGAIHQGPYNMPVVLSRSIDTATAVKPQTPRPPFNYAIEEVEYDNNMQQVHLGGTFTRPNGPGRFPVVLLITGSGQQDRDETIGLHKPFWVIADQLTKNGIAVLRVDDRGIGKSTGSFKTATTADFATDVMAGIDYLKTRPDIDIQHIGLLGHSEGGIIAPYVAARDKDVNFIVSLAGPIVGGRATNDYQNILPLQKQGVSKAAVDAFLILHHALTDAALNTTSDTAFKTAVEKAFLNWRKAQSPEIVSTLVHGDDAAVLASFYTSYKAFKTPWWTFFLTHNFKEDLANTTCAVLALNGQKDEQVESQPNLAAFETILKEHQNKHYKTVEIPGVNHLFQQCTACGSVQEYLQLNETFSPAALDIITNWIKATVK